MTDDAHRGGRDAPTLTELLRHRAAAQGDDTGYVFLLDGEHEELRLSYAELDRQARAIAAALQSRTAPGERALLLYPPGLDYIAGLFGCLYAGVIAVPAYPPDPTMAQRTLPRVQAIAADARASVALATSMVGALTRDLSSEAPTLEALSWIATDDLPPGSESAWKPPQVDPESVALLQYTSGSTGTPKGVMLSHANLLYNIAQISTFCTFDVTGPTVSWLPPYHDMGLIFGILTSLYMPTTTVLLSPLAFLERPRRWVEAMSRYGGVISGGPGFAYDLCVRRTTPEERATLDLSRWRLAAVGAEPVQAETLQRFIEAFRVAGFRPETLAPGYGLAEATLMVSGGARDTPAVRKRVARDALERGRAVDVTDGVPSAQLVGCGRPLAGQRTVIVDPDSCTPCGTGEVGEIWVAGRSIAQGYWGRSEETAQTFGARLADGDGPFLRSGDLGFLDAEGNLFVTGRLKDLIIIRGANFYPDDIESTVTRAHPALRPGCGAAVAVEFGGEERLVVVQEVRRGDHDLDAVVRDVRLAVSAEFGLPTYAIILLEPGAIPKTSSGKIQRRACRAAFATLEPPALRAQPGVRHVFVDPRVARASQATPPPPGSGWDGAGTGPDAG